ncbi:hypothetical protein U8V72_11645 [Priestia filamentosa]|uniref:hypothetical protein n=1 Tax=Priestia filamentosa TaxID=1402861 RepID=UPI00397B064E
MSKTKLSTLSMKASYGENEIDVEVTDLYWKEFKLDSKIIKEVVAANFHSVEPGNFHRDGNDLVFHLGNKYNFRNAYLIPFLDEYRMDKKVIEDSTRITFTREVKNVIMMEDEEKDSDEVKALKAAERKKQNRISKAHNLIFLDSVESVPYEVKEKVYNYINNTITTPMVPRMTEATVLAGQLFVEKKVAKDILNVVFNGAKTPIESNLLDRAIYLLKVYEKWVEVIFEIMAEERFISPLEVLISSGTKKPYEVIVDENAIEPLITEKIVSGELYFTENTQYDEIHEFNNYMAYNAKMMTNRIESIAKPIHRWNNIEDEVKDKFKMLVRPPFEAQRNAIAAGIKALDKRNNVSLICEMGTGKSLMSSAIADIHADLNGKTLKLLILCPDHLVDTVWEEELHKTLRDITVHKITSVSDLIEFEKSGYLKDITKRAFILGQKFSKTAFSYRPSVRWGIVAGDVNAANRISSYEKGFSCPCCGEPIKRKTRVRNPYTGEMSVELKPVPFTYFEKLNYHNYKCKKCDTVLWEPLTKTYMDSDVKEKNFVYSGDFKGFYPTDKGAVRKEIEESTRTMGNYAIGSSQRKNLVKKIEYLRNLENIILGKKKEGVKRPGTKTPVAKYIFKKMRYQFTHLIADEFHEYGGDSKRGDACASLIHSIKYVITSTGTAMNGYANSRFKADFMLQPDKMKRAGYTVNDSEKFQVDFGVVEKKYKLIEKGSKKKRESLAPRKRPGISPLIFPLFMQDTSIFVTMEDMANDMPPLEHYNIDVEMDEALRKAHDKLVAQIRNKTSYDKKIFQNTVQLNYSFLDIPTKSKSLYDADGNLLVRTPVIEKYEDKKLSKLLGIAKEEIQNADTRMMIYTHYSSDNINGYLYDNLIEENYKVTVLNPTNQYSVSCDGNMVKVKTEDREKFIRAEVEKGTEILITNPELVKTGLNLMAFPTILYYQMSYQVFTNRQADRRAWRLGQDKLCKVIYLYYKDSIQQAIASLMATKIIASRAIEGSMDESGLEAIADSRTAEEELSNMFYNGIKDTVKGFKSYPSSAA